MKYIQRALAITCAAIFAVATGWVDGQAAPAPASRTVIDSQSELPTYSYTLTTPTASALLDDKTAQLALAGAVRNDAETTLAKYEITDKATLRDLYSAIRDAALIQGDVKTVLADNLKIRELGDKPAEKLTSGLTSDAAAAALAAGDDPAKREEAFTKTFAAAIDPLPWPVVRDDVIAWRGQFGMPSMDTMMRGGTKSNLDPVVESSGQIPWSAARELINGLAYLHRTEPYSAQAKAVLDTYIAAHRQVKPDIWPARQVALDADKEKLTPVVLAVWEEGVDASLFPGRLFTNHDEKVDGKDDDGNGFVDDVHGIGYDENDDPITEPLIPLNAKYPRREAELRELNIGRLDIKDGIDSTAAQAYRERMASQKPEEAAPLREAEKFYGSYYAHGTHVAGIAMDSNPAARLMVIRFSTAGYKNKPPAQTPALVTRWAEHYKVIVDYMKAHEVRVVNMSWGSNIGEVELSLEKNGIGTTASERRKIAIESFRINADALTEAFRNAPGILFVPAAGNSNSDIDFARFIPADIDLPNVLTAGAVDQAGDGASFTSYGKRVRVYANGFQVDSVVPGGSHMRMSGTSMAAPQVTNLAAKLFAINPKLTPTEVIKLILDGATKSADGKRLLINPKASVALLETKH